MSKVALIEMKNVRVKRTKNEVFSDLTLTLPSDRSSAVIGPNGSGKSTLLKLIFRQLHPVGHEDSVFNVLGQSAWEMDRLRKRMAMVSQELQTSVHRNTTALQLVVSQFYSSMTTWAHQTYTSEQIELAKEHICSVGIGHLIESPFATMSTGEQRRCLLARALINDPEYLILDEPTSGLDIKATHEFMETMSDVMAAGKKLVLVTHHLDEVLPEIDWFVYLKQGKLIDEGNREQMLRQDKLSNLFEIPIQLKQLDGRYHATTTPPSKAVG